MGVRKRMGDRNEGSSKNPWYFNLQPRFLMYKLVCIDSDVKRKKKKKHTLFYKYQSTCLKLNCYWFILWYLACLGHTYSCMCFLKYRALLILICWNLWKLGEKKVPWEKLCLLEFCKILKLSALCQFVDF